MNHVIPAIIPESIEHLEQTLELVHGFAHEVQVDVVDGKFVPFTSWPYHDGETIADLFDYAHHFRIEMDLMLIEPEAVIPHYVRAGVRDIIVHMESVKDFERVVSLKNELGFLLGLSMNNDSPLALITDQIVHADYVQFMGIAQIGSQGQPFDERVLTHIKTLKQMFPDMPISVDGSVNAETIPQLRDAGVTRFISGSAIVKAENPSKAFELLTTLAKA
jgi:ribulose-phosphate 3-epimerase